MARLLVVFGVLLIAVGLLPVGVTTEARADTKVGGNCDLIPEDIWGYEYTKYCGGDGAKMLLVEDPPKGYVNGNLGKCKGMPDENLMDDDSGQSTVGKIWEGVKGGFNLLWEEAKGGEAGFQRGTKLLCVRGEMLQWQKGHEQGALFVLTPEQELDNPCKTLEKGLQDQCWDPRGKNPCYELRNSSRQDECLKSHPDFKTAKTSGPCAGIMNELQWERCETREYEKQKKKELAEKNKLTEPLEDILGWALIFLGVAGWVGVMLTAKGMAMAWYTGEGLAHLNRGGWVIIAVIMGSSASAIAGIFYI